MAEAKLTTHTVEKVVTETEERVKLTLTMDEVKTLHFILGRISGDHKYSLRQHVDQIIGALQMVCRPLPYANRNMLKGDLRFEKGDVDDVADSLLVF